MHEIPTTYGLKVFIRSDDTKPAPIEMLVLDPAIRLTWAEAAPKITAKALGRDERCGEQGLPVDGIIDTLIGILLVAATAACGTLVGTGATDVAPLNAERSRIIHVKRMPGPAAVQPECDESDTPAAIPGWPYTAGWK